MSMSNTKSSHFIFRAISKIAAITFFRHESIKRISGVLGIALFVCLALPINSMAVTKTTPTGAGTVGDPYLIANLGNLSWLIQTSAQWAAGKYFRQTADIDATETQYWDDADDVIDGDLFNDPNDLTATGNNEGFKPIGKFSTPYQFAGNYNGNNYTISNLKINRSNPSSGNEIGMFGYLENGTIQNLTLSNAIVVATTIAGPHGVGILTGGGYGTISNITISGGSLTGSGTEANMGALIGRCYGGTITNSISSATVTYTGNGLSVGGLIGNIENTYTITNCGATGNVTFNGTGGGGSRIGGFAGALGTGGTVRRCFSSGTVTINSSGNGVGGFVGNIYGVTIEDSYTVSNISVPVASNNVGGFFGISPTGASIPSFTRTYAAGTITGGADGGFGGYSNSLNTYTNSFWDMQTTGKAIGVGVGGSGALTGKTTAEMKTQSTFTNAGWDFVGESANGNNDYWNIDTTGTTINSGYPYLNWQVVTSYTVTTTATNGTITSTNNPTVNHGSTTTVTGTANANYYFTGVSGCGGTAQNNTNQATTTFSYTTGAITSACTVTATFAIKTYTVTANPSGTTNGTVTITSNTGGINCTWNGAAQGGTCTSGAINSGTSVTLTAALPAGTTIAWGAGCNVTTATTCIISSLTANTTISPVTSIVTYTVTPSAGAGGTINPSTPQTINHGSTTAFTVAPNAGYTASVGGTCGGNLVGTTYTTNAITANCTVVASFTAIPSDPGPPPEFIPNNSPQISYTGGWHSRSVPGAYNGTIMQIENITGNISSASFTFEGRGISWRAMVSPRGGTARVYIDGAYMGRVNLYRTFTDYNVEVFSRELSAGTHTIRIVPETLLPGRSINIDIFIVTK